MRQIVACTVLTLLLLSAPASAQSSSTGPDWNGWTRKEKVTYLLGWIDGRQSGAYYAVLEVRPELIKTWSGPNSPVLKLFPRLTISQLEEGINKFYTDYRNLHIQVRTAVELIVGDATGKQPLTDEYLNKIRKMEAERRPRE
jgi:hypothetical protein